MRLAIKFAYNGKKFHGYARQPKLKTVEGELIKQLIKQKIIDDAKKSCLRTASRTDRGVSALGNVAAFNTDVPEKNVLKKLKNNTDIIVYGIKKVEPEFYPRYAKWRIYRYYLNKNNLDLDETISTASIFTGEHNFTNFARIEPDKNPVRTINNITIEEKNSFFVIDFYAQTFLWHQIRRIVSAIEKIGKNKITKQQIINALNNPNKKVDFGLAPPEPLILKDVIYDFNFKYHKNSLKKIKQLETKIYKSLL
ncbi:MAG: tRNA pseudouridine(38-40) synthase TruA [Candidatus Thermoplasmatota archaeon]|jgi:tRNA pseudouridine38-40 synthase|nr:tRNA pseudouridine(38-40) synthase TruA [Candidatus Thermoplasmatota archaeon]